MKNGIFSIKFVNIIGIALLMTALTACGNGLEADGEKTKIQLVNGKQDNAEPENTSQTETDNTQADAEAGESGKADGSEAAAKDEDKEQAEEETGVSNLNIAVEGQGLANLYADNFPIGIALSGQVMAKIDSYEEVVLNNFNSITCENEMKPEAVLDKKLCQAEPEKYYESPAVNFDACAPAIEFALANDMKIRLHTLVWHSQTPDWFFTEDYTQEGALVSREVMLKRMENYIASVLGYFKDNYPGLIYAVDVTNEAFDTGDGDENGVRMKKNRWYDTVGDDYYYQAFVFARKYADEDMKLFYNDYACMWKTDLILRHLQKAQDEGLIDGIGMQSHLSTDDNIQGKFLSAVKQFCDAGYEVQITELDIGIKNTTEESLLKQGRKYKALFSGLKKLQEEGYNITGITVWGLNDRLSWRKGENPLLFNEIMLPKKAYEGAMLMDTVPNVE